MDNQQIKAESLSVEATLAKGYFNIPLYQRPYSWGLEQIEKLWEDLKDFCIEKKPYRLEPDQQQPEYFLGPVVIYKNEYIDDKGNKRYKNQIIDGQQRLTTLILLLHQLYMKLISQDGKTDSNFGIRKGIEKLLWRQKWDSQGNQTADLNSPALMSEVMTPEECNDFVEIMGRDTYLPGDKDKLLEIAKSGLKDKKSTTYKKNNAIIYSLIENSFTDGAQFKDDADTRINGFINVVLSNCKILYVECANSEAALRIFDTLNNRGMQLRDADIFKAAIFETSEDKKYFAEEWRKFEALAKKYTLGKESDDPLNDMFRQLMHYRRAEKGWTSKEIALRTFFETKENQSPQYGADMLNIDVFKKLNPLARFWGKVSTYKNTPDDNEEEILDEEPIELTEKSEQYLHVLVQITRNSYWRYLVTTYYLKHYTAGDLDKDKFEKFLQKTLAYTILHLSQESGNDFRNKIFLLLKDIYKNGDFELRFSSEQKVSFKECFKEASIYYGTNEMPRAILLLHAYLHEKQTGLIPIDFQIEHIFAKNWVKKIKNGKVQIGDWCEDNKEFLDKRVEQLGNKIVLERNINVKASDYKFKSKQEDYKSSKIAVVKDLAELNETWEYYSSSVSKRTEQITEDITKFIEDTSKLPLQ